MKVYISGEDLFIDRGGDFEEVSINRTDIVLLEWDDNSVGIFDTHTQYTYRGQAETFTDENGTQLGTTKEEVKEKIEEMLQEGAGAGAGIEEEKITLTIPANGNVSIPQVTVDNYIFGSVKHPLQIIKNAVGVETPRHQTQNYDIGNTGGNMIDSDLGNLCYNNFGIGGTTNLPFYAMDFGQPTRVDLLKINWWGINQYVPQNFRIEASNDLSSWDTIVANLDGLNIQEQDITTNSTTDYRYWRIFCVSGWQNTTYMVVSEMRAYILGLFSESLEKSDTFTLSFDDNGVAQVSSANQNQAEITIRYKK